MITWATPTDSSSLCDEIAHNGRSKFHLVINFVVITPGFGDKSQKMFKIQQKPLRTCQLRYGTLLPSGAVP
jgi:hypothetical protein